MADSVTVRKYVGLALSPIHVGSRSRGLSGVDLSIVRDIDGLPIIPATTLKGCARSYSFLDYGLLDCDGKGQQCLQPHTCASCAVYGYSSFRQDQSSTSLVRFSDAYLLLIPVQTKLGMIWLASVRRLIQSGIIPSGKECEKLIQYTRSGDKIPVAKPLTQTAKDSELQIGSFQILQESILPVDIEGWIGSNDIRLLYERCVIVPEEHFGAIANSALTVRTSVAVDNGTGSVKPGALFSIEAVARSSVFTFEVGYINPSSQGIEQFINEKAPIPSQMPGNFESLIQIVESGLQKFEILGVGGKRSRGFGQLKVWSISQQLEEVKPNHEVIESVGITRPLVFISHSSKDKMFVRRLAADLQRRHIKVWLDEREILVGDSLHRRISEGIEQSDFLILVLSHASIESGWVEREVNAGLMKELEHKQVIVLPILINQLNTKQVPALLRDRRYANFVRSYEEGLHDLVRSIREHWQKVKTPNNGDAKPAATSDNSG